MMATWLMWLPEELLGLVPIAIAVAVACGFKRLAAALVGIVVLMIFGEEIGRLAYQMLPWWALVLLGCWIGIVLAKSISEPLLGRDASNQMIGTLAADAVRGTIKLPFRILGWFWRMARGR